MKASTRNTAHPKIACNGPRRWRHLSKAPTVAEHDEHDVRRRKAKGGSAKTSQVSKHPTLRHNARSETLPLWARILIIDISDTESTLSPVVYRDDYGGGYQGARLYTNAFWFFFFSSL